MIGETAWVKHAGTGQTAEVPPGAIPQLMQSGWERMTDKEIADLSRTADEKLADDEAAMRAKAAEGVVTPEEAPEETPKTSAGKSSGKSSDTKGNS